MGKRDIYGLKRRRRVGVLFGAVALVLIMICIGGAAQVPVIGAVCIIGAAITALPSFEKSMRGISFEGIDSEKGTERRIRILFALGVKGELSFKTIKEITGHSAGAISQDLARLERKELIAATRDFLPTGTRRSTYRLTDKGRQKLLTYLDNIFTCMRFFEDEKDRV